MFALSAHLALFGIHFGRATTIKGAHLQLLQRRRLPLLRSRDVVSAVALPDVGEDRFQQVSPAGFGIARTAFNGVFDTLSP